MKIAAVSVLPAARSLRRALHTASGAALHLSGVALQIRSECGEEGQGEAPLPPLTPQQAAAQQRQIEAALFAARAEWPGVDVPAARDWLSRRALHPAACWALATALADLESRGRGISLAAYLAVHFGEGAALQAVAANELLAAETPGALEAEAAAAAARGVRVLKLKVGQGALAEDVARVAAARSGAGREVLLRLDANGAWDEAEARRRIAALRRFAIEFIEQPVAAREIAALARLRRAGIAIAADESARGEAGALAVLAAEAADVLVLKPVALGDFAAAHRCAVAANESGVGVVLSSLFDGPVSLWAALHLAAALRANRACGLATGALLQSGAECAPVIENGALHLSSAPGLGEAVRGAFAAFAPSAGARGEDMRGALESGAG